MKNTDTTKEEETREVELSVNADKKDNQILEKDLGEARISFIDDESGDMNDILNMGPQKRKSVNKLLPRQGDKGTIQDEIKRVRRQSSYGRTFLERQEIKKKRRRASHKAFTKKDLLEIFKNKTSHGSRNVGGHPPHDKEAYDSIEAIDYSTPDTVQNTEFLKSQEHTDRKWRGFFVWSLYLNFLPPNHMSSLNLMIAK